MCTSSSLSGTTRGLGLRPFHAWNPLRETRMVPLAQRREDANRAEHPAHDVVDGHALQEKESANLHPQ